MEWLGGISIFVLETEKAAVLFKSKQEMQPHPMEV
jgi:hypothetical protein